MMQRVNRYERCRGFTIFKGYHRHIEIWYCPAGYSITPHSHNDQSIELTFLFGRAVFKRLNSEQNVWETFEAKPRNMGKTFTISSGVMHSFEVSRWPLVFINSATFLDNKTPVSAALDFNL